MGGAIGTESLQWNYRSLLVNAFFQLLPALLLLKVFRIVKTLSFYFNFLSTFLYLITKLCLFYMFPTYLPLSFACILIPFFYKHHFKGTDVHSYSLLSNPLQCLLCVHSELVSYSPSPLSFLKKISSSVKFFKCMTDYW